MHIIRTTTYTRGKKISMKRQEPYTSRIYIVTEECTKNRKKKLTQRHIKYKKVIIMSKNKSGFQFPLSNFAINLGPALWSMEKRQNQCKTPQNRWAKRDGYSELSLHKVSRLFRAQQIFGFHTSVGLNHGLVGAHGWTNEGADFSVRRL